MRYVLFVFFAALGLSIYQSSAQTENTQGCPNMEQAPKMIIDRSSTLITFDGLTGTYTYLPTKSKLVTNSHTQIQLPVSYDNDPLIWLPQLSVDGTKLMGIFGDKGSARISVILILDLISGSKREFVLDLDYPDRARLEVSWIDNITVAVSAYFYPETLFSLQVFDVNTGLSKIFDLSYPGLMSFPSSLAKLSPDLIHYAYIGVPGGSPESLFNSNLRTKDHSVIYSIYFTGIRSFSWSPDGDHLIAEEDSTSSDRPQKLTILRPSGDIVTELDGYPEVNSYTHAAYSWSSDGNKLAFQNGDPDITIQILGLDDLTIVNTCLAGEPFWSADGNLVAIIQESKPTEVQAGLISDIFVYDLIKKISYRVSEYDSNVGRIVGWASLPAQ